MLRINNDEIHLTRGDTAYIEIPLEIINPDNTTVPYIMANEDVLIFSVKTDTDKATEYCFQIINTGSNIFHIKPEHTCDCEYGKYKYDVQLTRVNGDVFTVVEPTCFKLTQEVTH